MQRIPIEEAIDLLVEKTAQIEEFQEKSIENSIGYVLAEDIISGIAQPPFDRSPLDGYALKASDTAGASKDSPVVLKVVDAVMAGMMSDRVLKPGEAIRIMTGAPIPSGADCVIRQENTDYGEEAVEIYEELKTHDNICDAGEDFGIGEVLAKCGDVVDSYAVGILASAGISSVKVYRRPRVALYSTGDEIVSAENVSGALPKGKIFNSNGPMLKARLKEIGIDVAKYAMIGDTVEDMSRAIDSVIDDVDIIVTTGAVSVGQKDIMHPVMEALGARKIFWRIAIKPGSPTLAFEYKGKLVIALSGNPFGALANFELLVVPVLAFVGRDFKILPTKVWAKASGNYSKGGKMRRIIKGFYKSGTVTLKESGQQSTLLASLRDNNCLVDIPAGSDGIKNGEEVLVWLPRK